MLFFLFSVEYNTDSTEKIHFFYIPSYKPSSGPEVYEYPLLNPYLENSHYGNKDFLNQLRQIDVNLRKGEGSQRLVGIFTDISDMHKLFSEVSIIGEIKIFIGSCNDYMKSLVEFSKLEHLEELNVHFFMLKSKSFCKNNENQNIILSDKILSRALFKSLKSLKISFYLSPLEKTFYGSKNYLLKFATNNFLNLSSFSFILHKRVSDSSYLRLEQKLLNDLNVRIASPYDGLLRYENLTSDSSIKKIDASSHTVKSSYSYFQDQTITTIDEDTAFLKHFSQYSSFEKNDVLLGNFNISSKGPYSIDLSFL